MKKVLFTATVDSHILQFHLPFLKMFKENGYEVHVATNGDESIPFCDKKIKISFERSPFKLNNLKAIGQLRKVINEEQYDIIHTHTPMGSVVTRLAAKQARKKYNTRVIYTAHGFHFFKGAPVLNWLVFYPVEKYLSKYTDTLITINMEDYELAKSKFKKCKDIQYVPGVGIDEEKFNFEMSDEEKYELRNSLGIKDNDFVMIYPAELSKRKRQIWLINAISELLKEHKDIHLLLPGKDSLNGQCQELVKELKLENQIHFLGYRKDIPKLLKISNLAVSSARQEGLPVNLMEAMYVGLPIVASDCRGNRDLIKNNYNGLLINIDNKIFFSKSILKTYSETKTINTYAENSKKISEYYKLENITNQMASIYKIDYNNCNNLNILLSIIIPIFNQEKYLSKCLDSIVNQIDKSKNVEIILIDDGSFDKSSTICEYYVKKYKYIKYNYQDNSGVSVARNFGISKANGKYIYFVDSDDWLLPDSLNSIIEKTKYEPDIIISDLIKEYKNRNNRIVKYKNKYNNNHDVNSYEYPENINSLFKYDLYNLSLCCNVIKRDLIVTNNLMLDEKLKYTEDMDCLLSILLISKKIELLEKPIYVYRKTNSNSATSKITEKRIEDMVTFIDKWYNNALNSFSEEIKQSILNFVCYQYIITLGLIRLLNSTKKDDYYKMLESKKEILKYGKNKKNKISIVLIKILGINLSSHVFAIWIKYKNKLM